MDDLSILYEISFHFLLLVIMTVSFVLSVIASLFIHALAVFFSIVSCTFNCDDLPDDSFLVDIPIVAEAVIPHVDFLVVDADNDIVDDPSTDKSATDVILTILLICFWLLLDFLTMAWLLKDPSLLMPHLLLVISVML